MEYVRRVFSKAFAPTLRVVDSIGFTLPPVVGFAYWFSGLPVPDGLAEITAALVVGGAAVVLFIRFVTAPYFIWREDQSIIEALNRKIKDPAELTKAKIAEFESARRIELIEDLNRITSQVVAGSYTSSELLRETTVFVQKFGFLDKDEKLDRLRQLWTYDISNTLFAGRHLKSNSTAADSAESEFYRKRDLAFLWRDSLITLLKGGDIDYDATQKIGGKIRDRK